MAPGQQKQKIAEVIAAVPIIVTNTATTRYITQAFLVLSKAALRTWDRVWGNLFEQISDRLPYRF